MLTVATWNLENFSKPGTEGASCSEERYARKLDALAGVIEEISPDILAVQEVGRPEALDDLAGRLGNEWMAIASDHPDHCRDHHIRVGFLSRLPFDRIEQVATFPAQLAPIQRDDSTAREHEMGRGALHIRVHKGGEEIDLVTCHLKSKLLSFPGPDGKMAFDTDDEDMRARYGAYALFRRAAEATTVRAYIDRLLEGDGSKRAVVALGDLNDQPSAATTQILLGPPGSEFHTRGFDHPDHGDEMRMWSIAPLIVGEPYSREFEGHKELIDHILVSRKLADPNMEATVHHQAKASIGIDPMKGRDDRASDHDPVIARLSI